MDTVDAKNTFIKRRNNQSEIFKTVEVSQRTQKAKIGIGNERSGLAFFSTDLQHIFGRNVGNEFRVMFRKKLSPKPKFDHDFFRIHSLMIYTDLIDYSIVGDTKVPLLRCFPSTSKLKAGDFVTTGLYMNYERFKR